MNVIRALEVGLDNVHDSEVLEWAAREGRVVVTQDVNTLIGFAWDRVRQGLAMPGVIAIRQQVPLAQAIDQLELLAMVGTEGELDAQVLYITATGR